MKAEEAQLLAKQTNEPMYKIYKKIKKEAKKGCISAQFLYLDDSEIKHLQNNGYIVTDNHRVYWLELDS